MIWISLSSTRNPFSAMAPLPPSLGAYHFSPSQIRHNCCARPEPGTQARLAKRGEESFCGDEICGTRPSCAKHLSVRTMGRARSARFDKLVEEVGANPVDP